MERFFEDPGARIKSLAITQFIIGVLIVLVFAILLITTGEFYVFLGIILVPFGTFIVYIPSLYLYSMGELIQKMTITEENTREINRTLLLERQDRLDRIIELLKAEKDAEANRSAAEQASDESEQAEEDCDED